MLHKGGEAMDKMKVFKDMHPELKAFDEENRTITAVASTETPDRYGDVVLQDGWVLENFLKNPVMPWGHDYHQPPVAKITDIKVENKKLVFTAKFPEKGINSFADMIFEMYKTGFLNAFSVGFIPIEYEQNEHGGYTFKKQELLEISAVLVPANQEALMMTYKSLLEQGRKSEKTVISDTTAPEGVELEKKADVNTCTSDVEEEPEVEGKAVVPYQDLPLADMDTEWDAAKARKNIAKWASSDGSGDKDKVDWKKYRKGFLWYDAENPENFGSYKLPIADVFDSRLKAVPKAIFASAAAIQGARGGVDIPDADKEKIKKVLEKYYEKMDKTPPWAEEMVDMEKILEKLDELKAELVEIKEKLFKQKEVQSETNVEVNSTLEVKPEELKNLLKDTIKEIMKEG